MADKLIFPIGFDLEAAVKKAEGDADRLLRKLETTIKSRPLAVNLKIDNAGAGSINEINKRMGELVKQWNSLTEAERINNKKSGEFTPQAKKIIAEYVRLTGATESYARSLQQLSAAARRAANEQERNLEKQRKLDTLLKSSEHSIANVTAKLQHYKKEMNAVDVGSSQFSKAAAEVKRLTERLTTLQSKVNEATGTTKKQVNSVTQELEKQDGYVANLVKKMAVYASFSAVGSLLTRVREVTAEFELQRVSLGAIIQDQQRANELFSEIKAFALKSPLKILDLTKYTKQVAAYRIEQDKLFDTTRRLADVSVGLGVDMGRIVLAYGQVKAASYLRAAEIRQFTEAGIPMLELLAEKFSELSGAAVSTEEVMDKVSKRMVAFSMVEEIFEDMTSAGGMFYNMQEKQSQTLYGMWAKMGDAAAVMYEQMGNTAVANGAMKETIQLMSDMMLHWTALANVAQTAIIGFGLYKAAIAGLIPFYNLQNMQIMNSIKAEKAHQSLLLKRTSLYATLTTAQLRQLANTKKLTTAEWEEYITKTKLNQVSALRLARMAKENAALQKALINQKLYTASQLQQIQAMSKGQYIWANIKSKVLGIGDAFKSLGMALKTYLPLAAITAVVDLFMDWRNAVAAQEEAVKKVDKQYEEMKVTLMEIENAYRDVQNATKDASVSEDEFIKTSYSQKLEQLKKVIKLLGNFGMKNVIDPSVLNYTNIDPVLDKWLNKLNEVNELARGWGREVALVANAYEGNIFGWSIFGENLKEDMKDLERSWTKLTVNSEFNQSLSQLRAIVGNLANDNKAVYDNISKAIGADLKLALGQKRRNESELQYQQRIYKNYQNIESYLQTYLKKGDYKGMLPSLSSADVGDVLADFQSDVDEVMHEFDKVKEKFRNQDALSVKMAIDTIAAENDWTEWQKELLIQHLNEDPITLNAEIIPTGNITGQGAVAEGLKAIITSEFPTLFNENELQSLVSAEGIVDAIKAKLDASNESLEKTMLLQNNLAYGSKGFENSLERIKKLQKEISDIEDMRAELAELKAKTEWENDEAQEQGMLRISELEAKLQEVDEQSLNTKRAQIAAIVEANAKYEEQIQKQRESAEAEREIAKAALDRVTSMGLSDLSKDVKEQFAGLRVDAVKAITDNNYSTDFLISDEDLQKIRDVGDLYDVWAKNTKAIKDEKEKLVGVGITEATITKERTELEAKQAKIQLQLKAVEAEIANEKFKGQEAEYAKLKLALANATTAEAQQKAQQDLNKFLGDTKNAEFAILMMKKEGLKTSLQEALISQAANDQIADYLKGLGNAEELWQKLGERYNFKLQEKGKKGGSGEDPWIILMKNRMKFMQDFQKGVEDLSKWMGYTKGLADEQGNMLGRGLSLKIDSRELDGSKEELIKWYEDAIEQIRSKIAKMGGKEWEGLGVQMILAKDTKSRVIKKYQELLQEMWKNLTDFRTDQAQKAIEAQLKSLADRISRTKTAKEFYDKILSQTGDIELAAHVSLAIYGETGEELFYNTYKQIQEVFKSGNKDLDVQINAELMDAIDLDNERINYKMLADIYDKYQNEIVEKNRDTAQKIISEGQKTAASNISTWYKELAKAKSYEEQRTDIVNREVQRRAEIIKSGLPQEEKNQLISLSYEKQAQDLAKNSVEEFKNSDDFIKVFQNLDKVSKQTLSRMKERLQEMIDTVKDTESLEGLKALADSLDKIDEEMVSRGDPMVNAVKSLKSYISARKELKTAEVAEAQARAEYAGQETQLNQEITQAKMEQAAAQKLVDDLTASGLIQTDMGVTAQLELNNAIEKSRKSTEKKAKAEAKVQKMAKKTTDAHDKMQKAEVDFNDQLKQSADSLNSIAGTIQNITDLFGIAEDSDLGDLVNGFVTGLQTAATVMTAIAAIAAVIEAECWWMLAIGAAVASFSAIFTWVSNSKVRKANKIIEEQQELLEQLEYTYSRLEKAAEKAFGIDYTKNFNQQRQILEAQIEAAEKQLAAEQSKGKKTDDEKVKEYTESIRDLKDELADMQGDLMSHFTGTTKQDFARQLANSWIDARASLSDTFAAIKGDYKDMLKNMLVETMAAKIAENAFANLWEEVDEKLNANDVDGAVDAYVNGMDQALKNANEGLEVWWKAMEARGYDMNKLLGDTDTNLTGISRDIAGASEESINGLAASLNTQNYYISHVPSIAADVAVLRQLMEGGSVSDMAAAQAGWTDWQQQAMDNYVAIQRNTADMVVECRRAAVACEEQVAQLKKVIVPKGTKGAYQLNVGM